MANEPLLFASKHGKAYFNPTQGYCLAGLCRELGVRPAGFAKLTHRSTESVAKLFKRKFVKPKSPKTKKVIQQMWQIFTVFRAMGWKKDDISGWLHSPLPTHDGKAPLELIASGKGQPLIDELVDLATGNIGG